MGRFSTLKYTTAFLAAISVSTSGARSADWALAGTVLGPNGIIADGAVSISDKMITSVGQSSLLPAGAKPVKVTGIILPGFIDLHNHLTWNVLPRWIPSRKFNNRYEWQDTPEYDRVLVAPHNVINAEAACESQIYAEIKALVGGATSVVGSLLPSKDHPDNAACATGLARNLDVASGLPFTPPDGKDVCGTHGGALLDVVDNEVFPLELTHARMDFLLCELGTGTLRSLIIHLSEGAATDSSAHREFLMLNRAGLLKEGLVLIHGTALRDQDFTDMQGKVGLVWSPRSNDELYGSTTNIAAARRAAVPVAIAPDWSPSGSAGMLQEIGYVARRYGWISSDELLAMGTSVPATIARLADYIGVLAPNKLADFLVINANVDPKKSKPLDPVVRATPADISLVVVGGQPVYGDPVLLAQLLPAGTKLDSITVCGAEKAIYLAQSGAAARGQSFEEIKKVLNKALAKGSSSLPDIECD